MLQLALAKAKRPLTFFMIYQQIDGMNAAAIVRPGAPFRDR
jgi:hypothetical protein